MADVHEGHDGAPSPTPASQTLLLVFVHGFKGSDDSFGEFPRRLSAILSPTLANTAVKTLVFPSYDTKGQLNIAVDKLVDWLCTEVVQLESNSGLGMGSTKIVLLAHSMGGLVSADAVLNVYKNRGEAMQKQCLWPRVIGICAFDTPYLGLHPNLFKNGVQQISTHIQTARDVAHVLAPAALGAAAWFGGSTEKTAGTASSSQKVKDEESEEKPSYQSKQTEVTSQTTTTTTTTSTSAPSSSRWFSATNAMYALGAAAVAGVATTAYVKRNDAFTGVSWAKDHLEFVGNLWDEKRLKERLGDIQDVVDNEKIVFRNFYTHLPPKHTEILPRTFCVLPSTKIATAGQWMSAKNTLAPDEVGAHTQMFSGKTNSGYYDMGLRTAEVIALALDQADKLDAERAGNVQPEHKRRASAAERRASRIGAYALEGTGEKGDPIIL